MRKTKLAIKLEKRLEYEKRYRAKLVQREVETFREHMQVRLDNRDAFINMLLVSYRDAALSGAKMPVIRMTIPD